MSENSKNTVQRKQTAGQGVKAQLTPEQAARLAARRAQANGTAAKPAGAAQKTGAKSGQPVKRPAGSQPARKPNGNQAANAKKKPVKKKKSAFPVVIAILLVLALAVGGFVIFGGKDDENKGGESGKSANTTTPSVSGDETKSGDEQTSFAFASIPGDDNTLPSAGGYSVKVTDLSVTEGLDENWMNILLLGTDARTLSEPARTDTMIICSIHKQTGEVKLASIMRDTNVFFEGNTKNGTRINNAFFYGGPQLAMKVVNECFGMNIEKYVCVNFDGFAVIAEMIGGVDMVITENEMKQINHNVMEQYHIMIEQGKIEYSVAEKEYYASALKTYTTNNDKIHLNGMQALGYARIRKLDSDYARTDRQRKVLNALMEELKGQDILTLTKLGVNCMGYFNTNLSLQGEILQIASLVLNRADFKSAETMHLPVTGTYKEEYRNNDARLYDMDIEANTRALYEFIYK